MLLDHVDHAERLHLDGARVVVEQHRRARLALLLVEHAVAREEVNILRVRQPLQRVDARVDAPNARLGQRLLVGLVVVVAVEDDLPVLVERRGRNLGRLAARLDLVCEVAKRVSPDGAEHRVDERHVLRRANRAELEAVSAVREGRRAIPVLGRHRERGDLVEAEVNRLDGRRVLLAGLGLAELVEVRGHRLAEVRRDDGGGRLARSEPEVVAGRRDRHAHQVAVQVDGAHDARHQHGKDIVRARRLCELGRVEEVDAGVGAKRDVVVFAGAVDVLEGLLLWKASEAVPSRDLVADLHHHQVLVDLRHRGAEEGCKLILVGRDLAVARAERDAEHKALMLDLLHALERHRVDCGHVVVAHLLAARRVLAHNRAPGELEIGAAVVVLARHKEELLLEADVGANLVDLVSEQLEEARRLRRDRLLRAQERRLLVEGVAVEGDEDRGDEDSVAAEENGGGRVDDGVPARCVRRAHPTRGVRRAVGLALKQRLALKLPLDLAVLVEGEHGVVDLAGLAVADAERRHRLEPVRHHACAVVVRPVHHRGRDLVGRRRCPRRVVEQAGGQAVLGEVRVRDGALEAVLAVLLAAGDEVTTLRQGGRRPPRERGRGRPGATGTAREHWRCR
mmetsp:Transcript_23071/g.73205  ORF Transcript_23071/g.73205 Transcript_23071/m.73205 type:complete len:622 (-) Transcript_23071:18-1883(-)